MLINYLRPLDCRSSVSIDEAGDDSFCSGVTSALLDGERDLKKRTRKRKVYIYMIEMNWMNFDRKTTSRKTADNYRRRVRFDPDGVRGLRSRGEGDDESLRFVFCSRLTRLRCVVVVIVGVVAVVLKRKINNSIIQN